MPDTPPYAAAPGGVSTIESPPTGAAGIVRRLGPGLIIAASIVGSGELIATTKTGADAGVWLLWLIVIGCVIKVFVQIEFGRFAVSEGGTAMDCMNAVPGPRLRANWLMWYWLVMFAVGMGQVGGILGGVGQSMAIALPVTGDFVDQADGRRRHDELLAMRLREAQRAEGAAALDEEARERVEAAVIAQLGNRPDAYTWDDVLWSAAIAAATIVMLVRGSYDFIQNVSIALVAAFTGVTIYTLAAQQSYPQWAISWQDLADGLSFRLPPKTDGVAPLATALATFGIIGVGASEVIAYPYWCLERGYARFTGARDPSPQWTARALGWMRVMRWDALLSMVVYTFATLAFYLLGATALGRQGLSPRNDTMVPTLARMFEPVFGEIAVWIFLVGAIAVLYSTFFVGTAGNARSMADALRVFRVVPATEAARRKWIRLLCAAIPALSLTIFTVSKNPVTLVLASGVAQAFMLPLLGIAALYFRYRRCDRRIAPGSLWDLCLWLSVAGLAVAGFYGAYQQLAKLW